jgi:protein arginine kinase
VPVWKGRSLASANELFIRTQPAHLQKLQKRPLESSERNAARARFLRQRLSGRPYEDN